MRLIRTSQSHILIFRRRYSPHCRLEPVTSVRLRRRLFFAYIVWLVLAGFPALAQVDVEVLSSSKTASPGEFVTHVFSIKNVGSPDTFSIDLSVSPGLDPLTPPSSIALGHDEEESLFISVLVTAEAEAGENYVQLTVTSRSDPAISATATAIVIVLAEIVVEILSPSDQKAGPGERVELEFTVINRGNTPDTFGLEASTWLGSTIELEQDQVDLLPGEAQKALVWAVIPLEAEPGRERIILKATSFTNPEVFATASVAIIVLPPPPQAIGGTLYPELPATLELRVEVSPIEELYTLPLRLMAGGAIDDETSLRLDLRVADVIEEVKLSELLIGFTIFRHSFFLMRGEDIIRFNYLGRPGEETQRWEFDLRDYHGPPERHDLHLFLAQASANLDFSTGAWISSQEDMVDGAIDGSLGFHLAGSLFKLGLSIHGPTLGDRVGVGLSYRASPQGLPSVLLFQGFSLANMSEAPAGSIITTLRSVIGGRHDFGGGLPTVRLRADFEKRFSDGINPDVRQIDRTFYLQVTQTLGPASLYLETSNTREIDHVTGTDYEISQYGQGLSMKLVEISLAASLRLNLTKDLTIDEITGQSHRLEASLAWHRASVSSVLKGTLSEEGLSLFPQMTVRSRDWEASVETMTSVPFSGGDLGFELTLDGAVRFNLPLPFIKTKARVEGYVFIDENSDGLREDGEPGVSDVFLEIDGTEVRSNSDGTGFYRFPPLRPGSYQLRVGNLPVTLASAIPLPLAIKLRAGQVMRLDIPVVRVAAIKGIVFNDGNRNGLRDSNEWGLPGVRVVLSNIELKDIYTDSQGEYVFFELKPGRYSVSIDTSTLPERFEPTTPTAVEVLLEPGEVAEVNFGAAESEREIIITFQPPIAEFTYAPKEPQVNQAVTFDGSPSFDPDGQIVKYEWDFDGDKTTDAEGKIIGWVFSKEGDYPVTLIVTDNDGYRGTATKTITASANG